jgi:GAF domain-containing protein
MIASKNCSLRIYFKTESADRLLTLLFLSQFGTMQLFRDSADGSEAGLQLLISRGLTPENRAVWEWVSPKAYSSCTLSLKTRGRTVIPDYETWDEIAGTADLKAFRRAGIRSAQTTPLFARGGALLGMISTHWSKPHEPSERDVRMLDILARQAADLLERTLADRVLRERQKELENTVAKLQRAQDLQKLLSNDLTTVLKISSRWSAQSYRRRCVVPVNTFAHRLCSSGSSH